MPKIHKILIFALICGLSQVFSAETARPERGSLKLGVGKKAKSKGIDVNKLNLAFTSISEQVAPSVVSVNTFGKKISVR